MIEKTAMIAIVGRPNAGKSTLINTLVGEKIAIVSNKPQTTRNRICGVLSHNQTQMVFIDTPGFHKARTRLGDYMVKISKESVSEVDAAILMVEPIANVGEQEQQLLERIQAAKTPVILAVNKIDTLPKEALFSVIEAYTKEHTFAAIVPISARLGDGTEALLNELEKFAIAGPQLFPDDMVSDQPEKQICAEIVREKLLRCLDKEIPHGTAVEVTKFSERDNEIIDLDVTIYCEKQSHKGIIIGKKGAMLKKIGEEAREEIEHFMGTKVFLQTWVKVKENWRDSQYLLQNFGYTQ